MDEAKRERLEAQGWKVGTVAEFLELTPEETALLGIKWDRESGRWQPVRVTRSGGARDAGDGCDGPS